MKVNNVLRNNASISNTHNKLRAQQDQNARNLALKNGTKQNTISNKENTQRVLKDTKLFKCNRAAEVKAFTDKELNFKNLYVGRLAPKLNIHTAMQNQGESNTSINMTITTLNESTNMSNIIEGSSSKKIYTDKPVKLFPQLGQHDIALQSPIENSPNCLNQSIQQEEYILSTNGQKELEDYLLQEKMTQQLGNMVSPIRSNSLINDFSNTSLKNALNTPEVLKSSENFNEQKLNNFSINKLSSNKTPIPEIYLQKNLSRIEEEQDDREISVTSINSFKNDSNMSIRLNQNTSLYNTDDHTSRNIQSSNVNKSYEHAVYRKAVQNATITIKQMQKNLSIQKSSNEALDKSSLSNAANIPQAPYHPSMPVSLPKTIINSDNETAPKIEESKTNNESSSSNMVRWHQQITQRHTLLNKNPHYQNLDSSRTEQSDTESD